MSLLPKTSLLAISVLFAGNIATTGVAHADSETCIPVRAVLKANLVPEACPPVNLCTTGAISRSWLSGTTVFTGTAAAPAAGLPTLPGTTLSYSGTLVLETYFGNLELDNVGVFDTDPGGDGDFSQMGAIVSGTGLFSQARGTLYFYGHNGSTPGSLFSRVRGKVCFDD